MTYLKKTQISTIAIIIMVVIISQLPANASDTTVTIITLSSLIMFIFAMYFGIKAIKNRPKPQPISEFKTTISLAEVLNHTPTTTDTPSTTYSTTAYMPSIAEVWNTHWPKATHTGHQQEWRMEEALANTNTELINIYKQEGYFEFCDKQSKKEKDAERKKLERLALTEEPYYGMDDYDDIADYGYDYIASLTNCTCRDFQRRKLPCKHIYRLFWEIEHANKIAKCPALHSMDHDYFYEILKIDKYMALFKNNYEWLKDNEIKYESIPSNLIKNKYYIETELIIEDYLDTYTKDALIKVITEQNISEIKKSWTKSKILESLLDQHRDTVMNAIGKTKAYRPDPALHEIALYNTPSDFLENDPEEINTKIRY